MALMRKSYHASSTFPVGDFGEKEWREYIWAYYRKIEGVDKRIGRVLDALRESGQEDDTVVLFTSDHGDCQGAHRWNQKTVFYEESARVAFIISCKGLTSGTVSRDLVHTGVDLLPTLCDYAGIVSHPPLRRASGIRSSIGLAPSPGPANGRPKRRKTPWARRKVS